MNRTPSPISHIPNGIRRTYARNPDRTIRRDDRVLASARGEWAAGPARWEMEDGMRFSEWRAKAPFKESVAPKVLAIVEPALELLGADRDPDCWVAWGDDPASRYTLFAPTASGLAQVIVRVNVPGEGPRASGKVVRWGRVQLGELAIELQGGHRLMTLQVETQVLKGADAAADAIGSFAQQLFAAVDGRPAPATRATRKTRPTTTATSATGAKSRAAGLAAKGAIPVKRLAAPKGSTR